MLSQKLLELGAQLAPTIAAWPRRQPGLLMVDGKVLRYADLHSLYHQIRQLFGERLYDFDCEDPAPLILDCGAHVGLAALAFKQRYPKARVTAFEADGLIADMCRSNVAALGAPDVKVLHAAVWTHDRGVNFASTADDAGHVTAATSSPSVPSVRLKSLLAGDPIDFLKLDVEGAEFEILADCGDALGNVHRLAMEVHALDNHQARIGDLLSLLERQGFRYTLGDLHAATWMPSAQKPPFAFCRTEKFIVSVFAWRPGRA